MQALQKITNEVWLTSKEACDLLNTDRKGLLRKRNSGEIIARDRSSGKGGGYEYLLSSFPEDVKEDYYINRIRQEKSVDIIMDDEELKLNEFAEAYANAPEYNRRKYDKYMSVINAAGNLKGKKLKYFIDEWNMKHPEFKTSWPRVMDARKTLNELGPLGLLGSYGKLEGSSTVDGFDFEYFKTIYLKEGAPGAEICWRSTYGNNIKINEGVLPEKFPSVHAFMRKLKNDVPEAAIFYARNGYSKYNRKFASYINRDYSKIKAGAVWVSDHKQMDQAVMRTLPKYMQREVLRLLQTFETEGDNRKQKNKPAFPWLTAWRCFKTGKWLGWTLHIEDPNSDHIFQAFFIAADKYGIPEEIIIDNGKDYRCRDFAGGRRTIKVSVDEVKTRSLVGGLNIIVHFSLPYNAQTKPIERDFLVFKLWLDRGLPGYRGGDITERPENLEYNIKHNKILDYDEFEDLLNFFVENILHKYKSEGKNLLDRSRDEAWEEEFEGLKRVTTDALKMFCMRTSKPLTIGRNGVTVSQKYDLYYYADWMLSMKGKKVYIRRNVTKYQEAYVFGADVKDDYLGKAYLNVWTCNALVKTDLEKQQLEDLLRSKRRELKIMEKYSETNISVSGREYIENIAMGLAADNTFNPEAGKEGKAVYMKTKMDEVLRLEKLRKTGTDDLPAEILRPLKDRDTGDDEKAWWEV